MGILQQKHPDRLKRRAVPKDAHTEVNNRGARLSALTQSTPVRINAADGYYSRSQNRCDPEEGPSGCIRVLILVLLLGGIIVGRWSTHDQVDAIRGAFPVTKAGFVWSAGDDISVADHPIEPQQLFSTFKITPKSRNHGCNFAGIVIAHSNVFLGRNPTPCGQTSNWSYRRRMVSLGAANRDPAR